jgi:hypothetical protein
MGQGSEVYLIRSARPVRIDVIALRLPRCRSGAEIARAAGGSS